MGTDNLFHTRKAKAPHDLKRRAPKRASYDKVLIVCEGGKTEPNYLNELKDHYELDSANIRISGQCGSDPVSVVECGERLYKEERQKGDAYDRVYFVFDRDSDGHHQKFYEALSAIKSMTPKKPFIAVPSVPCFEYWLLLHFEYTTSSSPSGPGSSPCEQMESRLKRPSNWPEYKKAAKGAFSHLLERLDRAKHRAVQALSEAESTGTDNPSTHVHELVEYLQKIKDKPT